MSEKKTGLELLRAPFERHQISMKPVPTKKDNPKGKCDVCGGYHGLPAVHLDYVGHAALTDRLLDCDPNWSWEPLSFKDGLPQFDSNGGLWIRLTVCGVTRLGYGHAEESNYKDIGSREKEVIGDALRNAAMRFGAALDLWHKGDLHGDGETKDDDKKNKEESKTEPQNSSEYVIKFGKKMAGKKIKEFSIEDHRGMLTWLEDQSKKANKPISGPALEYFKHAEAFIIEQSKNEPKFDSSENIPF